MLKPFSMYYNDVSIESQKLNIKIIEKLQKKEAIYIITVMQLLKLRNLN